MLTAATPTRVASPIQLSGYLSGPWQCVSKAGGKTNIHTTRYSHALRGHWIRTINSAKNSESEDMMTYGNHAWIVHDLEPTGMSSVLEAPDTGLAHIALKTKYPKPGLNVTFNRLSMRKYTLRFSGTVNAKPASREDVCTKM